MKKIEKPTPKQRIYLQTLVPSLKNLYIKTEIKSFIEAMVDSQRNNEETIGILDEKDKVIELVAMSKYRRLPRNIRDRAINEFIARNQRQPLDTLKN